MKTLKQFKQDVRKAKAVFGMVMVSEFSGKYIQLVKSDVLLQVSDLASDTEILYNIDTDGTLYIN